MITKAFRESREMLKGKNIKAIGVYLIYILLVFMFMGFDVPAGFILLALPSAFGLYYYFLNLKEGKEQLEDIIEFYKDWKTGLKLLLATLWYLIIVSIGFILLIVPGIIWSFRYVMIFYILIENRDMKIEDAFTKSKEMMHGNKFKYFVAGVTFLILPMITYYIGLGMITSSVIGSTDNLYQISFNENEYQELDRNDYKLDEELTDIDIDAEEILDYAGMNESSINVATTVVGFIVFFIGLLWLIFVCPRVLAIETAFYLNLKQ